MTDYVPKLDYSICKCNHDFILHRGTNSSRLLFLFGIVGLLLPVILISLLTNDFHLKTVLSLIVALPIALVGMWRLIKWYYENPNKNCECCSCSQFESVPRPYGGKN
jgi:hypothetical protein